MRTKSALKARQRLCPWNPQASLWGEIMKSDRTLEEVLSEKYSDRTRNYGSVVVQFMNDVEGRQFKDKLNLCREIRNLLSHHPEVNGEKIIEPSQAMLDILNEVINYVKRPPLAISYATPFENLLKASLNNNALTIMKKMEHRGFSHVPVLNGGKFIGVFSVGTIFMYILGGNAIENIEKMEIGDFRKYLPFEAHTTERFRFISKSTTVIEAKTAFEQPQQRSRRLVALFITDNGSQGGRLLGMITPWDILRS